MSVTSSILQRTFNIRCDGQKSGTCFTADVDGRRYLITARHIVNNIVNHGVVDILRDGNWLPLEVQLVGHGKGEVDVSVLAPNQLFGSSNQLSITTVNMTLAEDVFFLGFPFGMSFDIGELNDYFPMPLVKKAIVSGFITEEGVILLDGHNNPGFSGGPVVRCSTTKGPTVIGVISAYRFQRRAVLDNDENKGPYTYDMNTGIVYVYDARQITKLIKENPIGLKNC